MFAETCLATTAPDGQQWPDEQPLVYDLHLDAVQQQYGGS